MPNNAGRCKVICSYNLVYNIFDKAFDISKFSFRGALFERILT